MLALVGSRSLLRSQTGQNLNVYPDDVAFQ
jgi:hypothetical protein